MVEVDDDGGAAVEVEVGMEVVVLEVVVVLLGVDVAGLVDVDVVDELGAVVVDLSAPAWGPPSSRRTTMTAVATSTSTNSPIAPTSSVRRRRTL